MQTWRGSITILRGIIENTQEAKKFIHEACIVFGDKNCELISEKTFTEAELNFAKEKIEQALLSAQSALNDFSAYTKRITDMRNDVNGFITILNALLTNDSFSERNGSALLRKFTLLDRLLVKIQQISFGLDAQPQGDGAGLEGIIICVRHNLENASVALVNNQPLTLTIVSDFLRQALECFPIQTREESRKILSIKVMRTSPWSTVTNLLRRLLPPLLPNPIRPRMSSLAPHQAIFTMSLSKLVFKSEKVQSQARLVNGVYLLFTENRIQKLFYLR